MRYKNFANQMKRELLEEVARREMDKVVKNELEAARIQKIKDDAILSWLKSIVSANFYAEIMDFLRDGKQTWGYSIGAEHRGLLEDYSGEYKHLKMAYIDQHSIGRDDNCWYGTVSIQLNRHQYFTYFMIRRTTMTEKQYGYSMKGMYELIKRERARVADREKEAYRERQRRKFLVEEGIVIFDVTFHHLGVWVRGQPCANIERRWKHPDDIRNEVRVVFDTVIAAMGVDEVCKRMTIKKYGLEGLVK